MAGVLVGRLVKPSVLWLDAITCFAAGEYRFIVAHNRSITPGKHKTKAN